MLKEAPVKHSQKHMWWALQTRFPIIRERRGGGRGRKHKPNPNPEHQQPSHCQRRCCALGPSLGSQVTFDKAGSRSSHSFLRLLSPLKVPTPGPAVNHALRHFLRASSGFPAETMSPKSHQFLLPSPAGQPSPGAPGRTCPLGPSEHWPRRGISDLSLAVPHRCR